MEYYGSDAIPGWKGSLLVANLKLANVYRLKLSAYGASVVGDTIVYFQGQGRFRDVAVSADGSKIYVAADSMGIIKGAPGQAVVPPNKGCILEFSFVPTGIRETGAGGGLRLYPNPASERVTLELPPGTGAAAVSVYNMMGEKILQTDAPGQRTELNVTGLAAGAYMIEVVTESGAGRQKLVIR